MTDAMHGVPSGVIKTNIFMARRNVLCGYVYALLRTMEHAAAWTPATPDIDLKLTLGQVIGFLGESIERISRRISTLLTEELVPISDQSYAQVLDRIANVEDDRSRSNAVARILAGLKSDMEQYIATTNRTGDAPTIRVLQDVIGILDQHLDLLRSYYWDETFTLFSPPRLEGAIVAYNAQEPIPILVDRPSRPATWTFSETQILSHKTYEDLMYRGEHMKRWLHQVGVDVEINATEVCARNIAEFREMPLDFKLDMARQVWDETRHALMMRALLNEMGSDFGDYTYSDKVWLKYIAGDGLAEKLAIEQVFQEGNALEANIPFCESLSKAGVDDFAEILDYVDADELRHAYFGNKWLRHLCDGSDDRYLQVMMAAAAKIGAPLKPRAPLHAQLRKMAHYPDDFIEMLAKAT